MIAMSGGVDSSVAALLMQRAGYACTGVTMRLFRAPGLERASQKSCCSDADEDDAAYVCWQLGIPFESLCCTKEFEKNSHSNFIREYEAGRTPNPHGMGFDILFSEAAAQCVELGNNPPMVLR